MSAGAIDLIAAGWIVLAVLLVPVQLRIVAPYGRHLRPGWGPAIPARLGWVVMESVSLAVFAALFLTGDGDRPATAWIAAALWIAHYAHRSLVFPFRTRGRRDMPVAIVASAVAFNAVNAGLNGIWLGRFAEAMPASWLHLPFLAGLIVFLAGSALNLWADDRLMALRRRPGAPAYSVPTGGMFRYVSCPNHLGEIVAWSGFAVMCWNLPALSFAIWTAANLGPRALSHHRWYREKFPDYPSKRKALVPFLL